MYFVAAHDGAEPSSNSIACSNLLRLAAFLDRNELKDKAARLLRAFGKGLTEIPIIFPQMTLALLDYHYTTQVCIIYVFIYVNSALDFNKKIAVTHFVCISFVSTCPILNFVCISIVNKIRKGKG